MITTLIPLWLLWLLVWLVFTGILVMQSRKLLMNLKASDPHFQFTGWWALWHRIWKQKLTYEEDQELHHLCVDYGKLLRVWLAMAIVVVLVRGVIFIYG